MAITIEGGITLGGGISFTAGLAATDPYWSSTRLLLPGNGSNGANNNTFRDSSTNNFGITKYGAPGQGSPNPFSSAAPYSTANGGTISFNTSSDYLSVNAQTALSFGTGDFTVECWVNPTAFNSAFSSVIEARSGIVAGSWLVGLRKISGVYKASFYTGTLYNGTTTIPLNAWTHIAWTRSSGTLRTFVNGTLDTSWTSITGAINAGAATQYIGTSWDPNCVMLGYMSNLRVVKGTAVYTSNFTPSTTPLTAIANTSLLLSGINGSVIDTSMNNSLGTAGNAGISTAQSKWGGSSVYFDGSGDYLSASDSTGLTFGTGDFTVECWINTSTTAPVYQGILDTRTADSVVMPCMVLVYGAPTWWVSGAARITGSTLTTGVWYHLAICRSSGTTKMYLNGTQTGSTYSDSNNYTSSSSPEIGALFNLTGYFNGYIDDLRITKGVARYTSNFSVPTEAFPVQG